MTSTCVFAHNLDLGVYDVTATCGIMRFVEDLYCSRTDDLVHEATKLYPLKIPVPHHQLRHFISTTEEGRIYYVSKHDIYTLNLETQQRCLLATLPFEARCLAADLGWICVGGEEKGDCAFLKIRRNGQAETLQDAFTIYGHPKCFGHDLKIKQLGGEIVNAMKIYKLPCWEMESCLSPSHDETVVLICNNDRTVKIYSLDRQQVLTDLEHDVAMNYATFSPDGRLLIAVGDSNEAFFYSRQPATRRPSSETGSTHQDYRWTLVATPSVPFEESPGEDFSFSVTFSPDGRLCAISSRGGYISIFDMSAVEDFTNADAIQNVLTCSFKSFRPPLFGCVRSMAFSPEPWGLFAWAEDHGRAGIADLRQGLIRRQSLILDSEASTITKLPISDATPLKYVGLSVKDKLKQQHLEKLNMDSASTSLRGSADLSSDVWAAELRHRQAQAHDRLVYHQGLGLDDREQSVLQALETTMDEVGETTDPNAIPNSATAEDLESSDNEGSWTYDGSGDEPSRRTGSRYHPPRRRSSVILSPSSSLLHTSSTNNARARYSVSPVPIGATEAHPDNDLHAPMSTNDLTPGPRNSLSQPMPYDIVPADNGPGPSPRPFASQIRSTRSYHPSSLARYSLRRAELTAQVEQTTEPELDPDVPFPPRFARQRHDSSTAANSSSLRPSSSGNNVRQQREDPTPRRPFQLETLIRASNGSSPMTAAETVALEQALLSSTTNGERHARILEERAQARQRARQAHALREAQALVRANAGTNSSASTAAAPTLPPFVTNAVLTPSSSSSSAATAQDLDRLRASVTQAEGWTARSAARFEAHRRISELQSRVSDNDMRLARHMVLSGARALDRNGNWVSPPANNRGDGRDSSTPVAGRNLEGDLSSLIEDALREMGPGTAGVGWSPDGRHL